MTDDESQRISALQRRKAWLTTNRKTLNQARPTLIIPDEEHQCPGHPTELTPGARIRVTYSPSAMILPGEKLTVDLVCPGTSGFPEGFVIARTYEERRICLDLSVDVILVVPPTDLS
jgi:hypothetical protein